jgi:hypothetical protein
MSRRVRIPLLLSAFLPALAGSWLLGEPSWSAKKCNITEVVELLRQPSTLQASAHAEAERFSRMEQLAAQKGGLSPRDISRHEVFLPYFDLKTGQFSYLPQRPNVLARENGDAEIHAFRMNWSAAESSIARQHFRSLVEYASRIPDSEIWVVVGHDQQSSLLSELQNLTPQMQERVRIVRRPADPDPWAQDGSKPLARGTASVWLADEVLNDHEAQMADQRFNTIALALSGLIEGARTPFRFEGGNVIVGARHVFIGSRDVNRLVSDLGVSRQQAIEALSREFGQPVAEVGVVDSGALGERYQPDFHIDLTFAVARDRNSGKEVIVLDSPERFMEVLLNRSLGDKLPQRPLVTVRNRLLSARRKVEGRLARLSPVEERLIELLRTMDPDEYQMRRDDLNVLAQQFEALGYEVRRIPGMNWSRAAHRGSNVELFYYNYTNSILSPSLAIVPEMGVLPLDAEARRVFESLGYDVKPAPVVRQSLCLWGGVRCLTEVYRRPAQ